MGGKRFPVRFVVLAVVTVSMLACWGCASENEDGGAETPTAVDVSSKRPPRHDADDAPAGDKEQIRALLRDIQADYDAGDGRAYCDKLIVAERREVAAFGRNFNRGQTCESTIRTSSKIGNERDLEQRRTTFVAARIKGRRAIARVSNGGRAPELMVFLKRGGEWKIVESGFEPDPLAAGQATIEKRSR
jgi:hypothetical protein